MGTCSSPFFVLTFSIQTEFYLTGTSVESGRTLSDVVGTVGVVGVVGTVGVAGVVRTVGVMGVVNVVLVSTSVLLVSTSGVLI
jgi:hypothetical protein